MYIIDRLLFWLQNKTGLPLLRTVGDTSPTRQPTAERVVMNSVCELPNGSVLYRQRGEQGNIYFSDEIGGGVLVWDTAMVDPNTLLAAIVEEKRSYTRVNRAKDSESGKQEIDIPQPPTAF